MYNLPHFKEQNEAAIFELIEAHPFAMLCGSNDGAPVATQVPVFFTEEDGRQFLRGHIMRNSDHHKAFVSNPNALIVFTGPHCYVSATWYTEPNQASTWNYMSVHAKGTIRFLPDEGLEEILRKTSLHFEKYDWNSPTVFDNLPEQYRNSLMKAIVAFEMEISSIEHVFKLSQNRDADSYNNIISQLRLRDAGSIAIAEEMEKRRKA